MICSRVGPARWTPVDDDTSSLMTLLLADRPRIGCSPMVVAPTPPRSVARAEPLHELPWPVSVLAYDWLFTPVAASAATHGYRMPFKLVRRGPCLKRGVRSARTVRLHWKHLSVTYGGATCRRVRRSVSGAELRSIQRWDPRSDRASDSSRCRARPREAGWRRIQLRRATAHAEDCLRCRSCSHHDEGTSRHCSGTCPAPTPQDLHTERSRPTRITVQRTIRRRPRSAPPTTGGARVVGYSRPDWSRRGILCNGWFTDCRPPAADTRALPATVIQRGRCRRQAVSAQLRAFLPAVLPITFSVILEMTSLLTVAPYTSAKCAATSPSSVPLR